jgi:hypothetical protein
MLKSARSWLLILLASWLSCAQALPNDMRADDYFGRAKQLLRRLYPGLDRNLRAVLIDENRLNESGSPDVGRMNHLTIELHDLEIKPGTDSSTCWCLAPTLGARLVFDWQTENKELVIMAAGGPFIHGRSDAFAEEMNKHPDWSDAQVISAMNRAHAKFAPGHEAEFLRALPVDDLRPFVGELEVTSVKFYLRDRDEKGKRSNVNPNWIVRAKWHGRDRQEKECTLIFEPFEGRLESFLRQ